MKITLKGSSLHSSKPGGIEVDYYLFDEYEVHLNVQLPNTTHTPHTFVNQTDKVAKFLVLKQVLSGEGKKELLKKDKVVD